MKAMILAAGRGKRLRPLTDTCPKPLLPLNGKPIIEYHLEKLAQAGIKDVIINHAWLGEQFAERLGHGERFGLQIHYSPEPAGGLETAGGVIQALPLLGEQPFILINGDVFTDYDFSQFPTDLAPDMLAHLILVPTPSFKSEGDFGWLAPSNVGQPGLVLAEGDWTFSGMSVVNPQLVAGYEVGHLALAPILRQAMQAQQVSGEIYNGLWSDIGTQARLIETEQQIQQIEQGLKNQ